MVVFKLSKLFIIVFILALCFGNEKDSQYDKESGQKTFNEQIIEKESELPETDASFEYEHRNLNIIPDVKTIFLE